MGKRKRSGPLKKDQEVPTEYEDKSASRLKIDSFEDVADSDDEFRLGRDRIALDAEPQTKRQRQQQQDDNFMEASDEEVLGGDLDDSDSEQNQPVEDDEHSDLDLEENVEENDQNDDDDELNWGRNISDYYDQDEAGEEEEQIEEAEEAKRLHQKQQAQRISDAEYGFDENKWAEDGISEDDDDEAAGALSKPQALNVRPDMPDSEKLSLLKGRYPQFSQFSGDLVALEPIWSDLRNRYKNAMADGSPSAALLLTKSRAISAYLGALSMYFAVLTSTAQREPINGSSQRVFPLDPNELRDHGILEAVTEAQNAWLQVRDLDEAVAETVDEDDDGVANGRVSPEGHESLPESTNEDVSSRSRQLKTQPSKRAARLARTEASLAELDAQLAANARSRAPRIAPTNPSLPEHDLGDEAPLSAEAAAEKARKRKSLRFYTSQIAQRQNKRSGAAARAAQGDDDLPYRERWRDRVERLNREAEARGRKADAHDDDDGDDFNETNAERRVDDAEYDELMGAASKKKQHKASRESAYQQAKAVNGRVVRQPLAEADGRREIGYAIQANKGLTPARNKANKNPRVKKRRRFEDKSKKLRTMKPTFRGGEGRGGYAGELTGIKKNNVRAVKF